MQLRSIRWQLSLSYAAIAFLATLCLGVVLLTVLDGYYNSLEQRNLQGQADSFSGLVADMLMSGVDSESLNNQVRSLSFLSDARVIVTDPTGDPIADSGSPAETYLEISNYQSFDENGLPTNNGANWTTITLARPLSDGTFIVEELLNDLSNAIIVNPASAGIPVDSYRVDQTGESGSVRLFSRPTAEPGAYNGNLLPPPNEDPLFIAVDYTPFFGFQVSEGAIAGNQNENNGRSNQHATAIIYDRTDRSLLGRLEISEGPSIGDNIIDSVAKGWVLAGSIAILSAAGAGWWMSRRIAKPILTLTEATSRMTEGDLSARADVNRRDELGTLAVSFNEMATRIETTVVTLRRFVADAAHELHTPLTALRTNLELNQEAHGDTINARALQQLERLEGLADDLLALSSIEGTTEQKPHQEVNMLTLINDISITYASWAEQADIDYVLDLPAHVTMIRGNFEQLRRMLSNLLDNAIKFTAENGTVFVALEETPDHLTITVKDTGIGIPPEDLPHLFSRFKRGRNTNTYPGSGLGLAIVKAITDAHEGTVQAISDKNGTAMIVTLPTYKQKHIANQPRPNIVVTPGYEHATQR
ncbi:MAG: HAMP domain-containing sensor histidine kinase [Aggregatilineales bacterium]